MARRPKPGQPDLGQRLLDARGNFRVSQTELLRTEGDVFLNGWAKQLVVRVLKYQADLPADGFKIFRRDRFTQNFYRAVAGQFLRQNAVQVQQHRGFAGTVWAEQRGTFARRDAEAHAAQRLRAIVVTVFQIGNFDGSGHGVVTRFSGERFWWFGVPPSGGQWKVGSRTA